MVQIMLCEMCSKSTANVKIELEGARLSVCESCSKHGKIMGRVQAPTTTSKSKNSSSLQSSVKLTEKVQLIKSDYSLLMRKSREKLNLTQAELANKLMEKESMLHNIESGRMKPSIDLARKIERFLKISIVEEMEIETSSSESKKESSGPMTLGDLIKIKK